MIFTVAIDGPAAAGKGTVSRAVAAHFGFAHMDTGLLYRAVGAGVLAGHDPVAVARSLTPQDLQNPMLRSQAVADAASKIAVQPEVRQALADLQRDFARRDGGAILDGRDIGTVICPAAEIKLFVTASAEVRARRRFAEEQSTRSDAIYEQVLADVRDRDARDSERAAAPLSAAADAVVIDTSDMTIEDAVARAIAAVQAVFDAG